MQLFLKRVNSGRKSGPVLSGAKNWKSSCAQISSGHSAKPSKASEKLGQLKSPSSPKLRYLYVEQKINSVFTKGIGSVL